MRSPELSPRAQASIVSAIEKTLVDDAHEALRQRKQWTRVADVCEAGSRILAGVATVLAFSASTFDYTELSFTAGCTGTLGVTLAIFSAYASKESRERTTRVNAVLDDIHASKKHKRVVSITDADPDQETENKRRDDAENEV